MDPAKIITIVFEIIIISLLLLASFIAIIIYFRHKRNEHIRETQSREKEYQQSLFQSQIEIQEATFSALGKELHDNIGQLLNSAKMFIGVAIKNISNIPEPLLIAQDTLGTAIAELRSVSKSLDKDWLNQFDFIENLQAETKRINSAKNLQVHFSYSDKLSLTSEEQIILFRIVQEAIQNTIKHADALNVFIDILSSVNTLKIIIRDDGIGFRESQDKNGMGINNMRHRTKLLGGSILWNALGEKGSLVSIELPVKTIKV